MDSENNKEESLPDNSELQLSKSFDESISENDTSVEKSLTDNIGNVSENINSDEPSFNKENILNSDFSVNEIEKDSSNLQGELTEANLNSGSQIIEDSQENILKEVGQFRNEDPAEPMIIDDANDGKTQLNTSIIDNKLSKSEEGEEVFSGFPTKIEDIQDFDIIKGLSRQEEVEIQRLMIMEDKPIVEPSRPLSALNKRKIEESDMSSHCSSPALSISSQQSVTSFTKRSRTESPASRGSRKSTVDLSNPKYLVPFEYGWRREVVTRAITSKDDGISKDVYYFHPSGKKLRSLREVSEKLTPGVTIENFTFYKEPLGADPQFETARNARGHGQNSPSEFGTPRTPVPIARPKTGGETPINSEGAKRTPPVRSFVKAARDNSRVAKQEKIVLKFNKGTPKIALKKSPAVNGESKSPKSLASKLEGPKINPNAPLGPKRIVTKRKNPLKPQNSDDVSSANQTEGSEMETGMMPPMWSPAGGSNISSSNESLTWSQLDEENYSALLNVFQYLKVQELLRAGRVCKLWRDLASHPSLWRTVRMKNSQVSDWQGFTDSLTRHGTKHLDLRKMLVALDEMEEMWKTFAEHIVNVQCLERLDMCRCSVDAIEQILEACPQLLVFNAQMIGVKDQSVQQRLSLDSFSKMNKLTELRMKSFFGFYLNGSLESLTSVADTLTMLSLTTVKELGCSQVHFVGDLKNLETLELGECSDLPETFPVDVISKLVKLKRIRFEKGPTKCSVNQMLIEMSRLPDLVQLELINFDMKPGFDEALASCTNIRRLMLIPTYVTHSATTNNIILSGAFRLWKSLTHFIWVVTMELLKVTELFVDQCEGPGSKKSGGNSVPVLKPVPKPEVRAVQPNSELARKTEEDAISSKNPITVIPLNELSEMLTEALPNTRVKLIKIPFQSTWRQCINFSDNSSASLS